jgi:hypothetical protein
MDIRLYLGTPETSWLAALHVPDHIAELGLPTWAADLEVPLFVSHRRLAARRRLPIAARPWGLDSAAYTELKLHGRFTTTVHAYAAAAARRYRDHIGQLEFVVSQDWPTDPSSLSRTGRTVAYHLDRTVDGYLRLREVLGDLVIPVLQGAAIPDDHLRCRDRYDRAGVDLTVARLVGVGSICSVRDATVADLVSALHANGIRRLHGFGIKAGAAKPELAGRFASIDSQVWSIRARYGAPLPGCRHNRCNNCPRAALTWYVEMLARLRRLRRTS